jgi:predicted dehydrogenase
MTQGIHTLDLMLSLAGPIVEVSGYTRTTPVHRMETEDLVCAAVRFASGAIGVIDATTAAYPGGPERIELIGTLGRPRSPARRSPCAFTMAGARRWRRTRHRAARAPTRWPSRTTITWACGAISSMRSSAKGPRAFPAQRP